MLARDPSRRYQTPAEAGEDLERFQKGEPVRAEPFIPFGQNSVNTSDPDATVRTNAGAQNPLAANRPDERTVRSAMPQVKIPKRNYPLLGCIGVAGLLGMSVALYGFMEVRFWNDAESFKADVQAERLTDLNRAWTEYETLNNRSHWGVLIWGPRGALRKKLVA